MQLSKTRYLRPNPHTLGVVPLAPGEASRPIRVRTKLAVFERLAGLSPVQIGAILERALLETIDSTARNALQTRFTRAEALALLGRTVQFRKTLGPAERQGKRAEVFQVRPAVAGQGYELELSTGLIVTRARFEVDLELLEG